MTGHAADKFSGTVLVSISLKARDLADSAIIAYWTESYGRGIDFHRRGAIDSLRALADLCGFDLVDHTTEATDRRTAEMNAELPQEAAAAHQTQGHDRMTTYGPWKIWKGGECPVGPDVRVQVQRGDWSSSAAEYDLAPPATSLQWRWRHGGLHDDITAYRVVQEPKLETVERYVYCGALGDMQIGCNRDLRSKARLTINLIDGKPDWSTIRAEGLE